jgi:class 3 adenylate cyclase
MASDSGRTLVCSVLFLDIAEYSRRDVAEQVRLKQHFNKVLTDALETIEALERVVIDTGDGAAIAFLGDPERALYVGLGIFDSVGELPVRMGINLGPVSLMKDINEADNVIGDGINVAQRIMGFAEPGELLVSRSFYDVVSRLSEDYASMFHDGGSRTDKHARAHQVYSVSQAVRVGRRVAEAQARLKSQKHGAPELERRVPVDRTPAQVFDAGTHYMISGYSEESVRVAMEVLLERGCKVKSPPTLIGRKWIASVDNPRAAGATVEEFGFKRIVSGPTLESVRTAVNELKEKGAVLVQEPELVDGVWTAVCERT